MKTLVIHPKDYTTDFLEVIYRNKGFTLIKGDTSTKILKEQIKAHDRIVMLGHGTEYGLICKMLSGNNRLIIDSSLVYLLREKVCVCIWCNADEFVKKYNLKCALYTGMIVSEYEEALMCCLRDFLYSDISDSNKRFAESIAYGIDKENFHELVLEQYSMIESINPIIEFNSSRIYKTQES